MSGCASPVGPPVDTTRKPGPGSSTAADAPSTDLVNHPPHYNAHPSGIECIEVVRHMGFNRGNAIKYLWRAGNKASSSDLDDLKKARWYVDDEIKRVEKLIADNDLDLRRVDKKV